MNENEFLNESNLLRNGTCGFYCLKSGTFHYHRQVEIVYVEKGTLSINIGSKTLSLHKNQFAVIKPYELHSFYSKKINKCVCPILPDYYSIKLSQINIESCILNDFEGDFIQILKLYNSFNGLSPENRLLYFDLIYKTIKNKLTVNIDNSKSQSNIIFNYIHNNFDKPISIEKIASACNTNYNYVSTIINKDANVNFNSYINRLRLAKFIDCYNPQTDKIIDVATFVGFESSRTFYRAFKNEYSMTTKEYYNLINTNK